MPIKSITTKFILAVLFANCLLLTIYYLISTQGFNRQFLQYLNEEEKQQVNVFADSLGGQFNLRDGEFVNLRRQWPLWMSNYFEADMPRGPREHDRFRDKPDFERERPKKRRKRENRERDRNLNKPKKRFERQSKPQDGENPKNSSAKAELYRRLALYDADKKHWVGPHDLTPQHYFPVLAAEQTVAYVGYVPRQSLPTGASKAFVDAFSWSQKILVIALLLLNVLLAFALTKHFILPIKQVMAHARVLTSGKYKTKFVESRRQDELGMLMKNMDVLAQTLKEQQDSQRRWLADVAHELRTPLAVLTGEIEAIVDGIRPNSIEQIKSLQQEVQHLQRLVEDLRQLSLSDMGALSYFFEQFDIGELLTDVIERMSKQLAKSGLLFEAHGLDKLVVIEADATRLTQVFHNILTNSCRYTDSPGQIKLNLIESSDFIDVIVEDSAPGVEEKQLEQLFEPLFRVDQARVKVKGGSGLGMSISRAIVKAHHGEISIQQSSLGGIKVVITLPKEQHATEDSSR